MLARIKFYIKKAYLRVFKNQELIEFELEDEEVKKLVEYGFLKHITKNEYEFTDMANEYFKKLLEEYKT